MKCFCHSPKYFEFESNHPTNISISLWGEGRMNNLGKCQTPPRRCNQLTQECGEFYRTNEKISSTKKFTLIGDLDSKQPNRLCESWFDQSVINMFQTLLSQWGNVTKGWVLDDINIKESLISRLVICQCHNGTVSQAHSGDVF